MKEKIPLLEDWVVTIRDAKIVIDWISFVVYNNHIEADVKYLWNFNIDEYVLFKHRNEYCKEIYETIRSIWKQVGLDEEEILYGE